MSEPIALIGSACRFPGGANSPEKLWRLLENPRDLLTKIPSESGRFPLSSFHHEDGNRAGATDVPGVAYQIDQDPRDFDAGFFNISPTEAEGIDPQQRSLLEVTYEALESSGYGLQQIRGSSTAVFVGVSSYDFRDIQNRDQETLGRWHSTGTAVSILSNRLSYFFDLQGPSMTIDTACSSSLVGLHLAVQAIRNGDCDKAIVAGTNLILDPTPYISGSKLHLFSPDGRCRMWDKSGRGYGRGEGIAVIVLKSLRQAVLDGDYVETIIRETGVNQDGRTPGITMPSSESQIALLRQVYSKAGLDPVVDKPQFFEAHGTGTAAGDPVEARAIHETFFGAGASDSKLLVGSIKTIIGHLEGAAGIAGLMKASLALRNRRIPPNMLFKEANPQVAPYLNNLEIPQEARDWPTVASGKPQLASVNSFGFGGTNAHAILEGVPLEASKPVSEIFVGPLVLSANSSSSLLSTIESLANHIRQNPSLNLEDLTWTLGVRRSTLAVKSFFSASSREGLLDKLDKAAKDGRDGGEIGVRTVSGDADTPTGILGIFTGQGAQWATMGRDLYEACFTFRESISRCQDALAALPDGPEWTLAEELLKDEANSRLSEAAISQPLCTALQIALVDLLRSTGVKLAAVVGHSSGEIAACYYTGILSARDAICIAYYRGVHSRLAQGPEGQSGSMMAVGLGLKDAEEFCNSKYKDRIQVAASNSPGSVTLSGDADAISEAKKALDAAGTFARELKVDKAYHSRHLLPCAEPYLKSLMALNIKLGKPQSNCLWTSSVRPNSMTSGNISGLEELKGQYWVDNLVNPVLFSKSIESSLSRHGGPFKLALEIGPHAALAGPAKETIMAVIGKEPLYTGLLHRRAHDVETMSAAVGYLWQNLTDSSVDLESYAKAFKPPGLSKFNLVKDLPTYAWDHKKYWRESRISRGYRLRSQKSHGLLGARVPGQSKDEMRWRNVLNLSDLPWLDGHQFQGQVIMPFAAQVCMIIEASAMACPEHPIAAVDIFQLVTPRAVVIEEGGSGTEMVSTLRITDRIIQDDKSIKVTAEWSCYVCYDQAAGDLDFVCSGKVVTLFGTSDLLPPRPSRSTNTIPVQSKKLYDLFAKVGLDYSGSFRKLDLIERRLGFATASASWSSEELESDYLFHPEILDMSFQLMVAAFASPVSGDVTTAFLPTRIGHVSLRPQTLALSRHEGVDVEIDAFVTNDASRSLEGEISIYDKLGNCIVQLECLDLTPFDKPEASNDRRPFAKEVWKEDVLGLAFSAAEQTPDEHDTGLDCAIERTAFHFMHNTLNRLSLQEVAEPRRLFFEEMKRIVASVGCGRHPTAKREWTDDSYELILSLLAKFPRQADLEAVHFMGQKLDSIMRGTADPLQLFGEETKLHRLYQESRSSIALHKAIAFFSEHVSHKFPNVNILEIGAGVGNPTSHILKATGKAYRSYTFTDVSDSGFDHAMDIFQDHLQKMEFKALDIQKDLESQGFQKHKYDLVISSTAVQAKGDVQAALKQMRSLLRPGGYLLLVEPLGHALSTTLMFGTLPGWFGGNERCKPSPGASIANWDNLLCSSGFSGVEQAAYDSPSPVTSFYSVIVSQAMSDAIDMLRDPLASMSNVVGHKTRILLIGGLTSPVSRLMRGVKKLLSSSCRNITIVDCIEQVADLHFDDSVDCICFSDMDHAMMSDTRTPEVFKALQTLYGNLNNLLWYTTGRLAENPDANISVGIARALRGELPWLNSQFIDVCGADRLSSTSVVESFARLILSQKLTNSGEEILWTLEPEVVVDGDRTLILRIVKDDAINDRFNTARRPIAREGINGKTPVRLVQQSDGRLNLSEDTWALSRDVKGDTATIGVKYSVSIELGNPMGHVLCLGSRASGNGGDVLLAISGRPASHITTQTSNTLNIGDDEQKYPELLRAMAGFILARLLSDHASSTGCTLIYGMTKTLARSIQSSPYWKDKSIVFASAMDQDKETPEGWISIHPRATRRVILQSIPKGITLALNCSSSCNDHIWQTILESVGCPHKDISRIDLCSNVSNSWSSWNSWNEILLESYEISRMLVDDKKRLSDSPTMPIQDIDADPKLSVAFPTILDWTKQSPVRYLAASLDPQQLFSFSENKSYLLVGMTASMGLSLSAWMVRSGARNLILVSRKPNVPSEWLDEMSSLGANIKVLALDVTDDAALFLAYREMCKEMPPIAGVCNASMVLSDGLFADMTFESFDRGLRPKVDGTRNLDQLFSSPDLDFFVLFGSIGSVTGQIAQTNYHGANLFMSSVVNSRRRRGLAASIMDIGVVTDVGVVITSGDEFVDELISRYNTPLSERVLHYLFGEAIMASPCDSGSGSHIIVGPEVVERAMDPDKRPFWFSNPRLSHFVVDDIDRTSVKQQTVNLLAQLNVATSETAMLDLVVEAFSAKLEKLLEMEPGTVANSSTSLLEMGVDSGLAVQISNWFSNNLQVQLSFIKILSAANPSQLCLQAVQKLDLYGMKITSTPPAATDQEVGQDIGQDSDRDSDRDSVEGGLQTPPVAGTDSTISCDSDDSISEPSTKSSGGFTPITASISSRRTSATPDTERTSDLSPAQSQLLLTSNLAGKETMYNMTMLFDITGPINPNKLKAALSALIDQQESLRSCFMLTGSGQYQQVVWQEKDVSTCFRHIPNADSSRVEEEYKNFTSHVWRLEEGETFAVTLATGANNMHNIIFAAHHIIMDGFSIALFFQELSLAYNGKELKNVDAKYTDFASGQLKAIAKGQFDDQLEFWRTELSPMPEPMPLFPTANGSARKPLMGKDGGSAVITTTRLGRDDVEKIKAVCRKLRCTPSQFLLAALHFLCAKMANVEDICIGIADAGRHDNKYSRTIGYFANVLPIRSQIKSNERFSSVLRKVATKIAAATENAQVPFNVVVDKLHAPRSLEHTPIFQVAMNHLVGEVEPVLGDSQVTWRSAKMVDKWTDLSFWIYNNFADGSYLVELEGRDDTYSADGVRLTLDIYISLLETLSREPETQLNELSLFPESAPQAVVAEIGLAHSVDFGWQTLVHRFEEKVKRHADEVAVIDESGATTYAQLSKHMHRVASALQDRALPVGSKVAVMCGPSANAVASMLAILRIQCVYVPLDLSLPAARHTAMIGDCQPRVLLYQSSTSERSESLRMPGMELLNVDETTMTSTKSFAIPNKSKPDIPAIILYTSGSTSVPKGVVLPQAGYINYLADKAKYLKLDREVVLQQSSLSFDMGLAQMLHSFCHGGRLVMVPQQSRGDPMAIADLMLANSVSFTIATPSEYSAWLAAGRDTIEKYAEWRHACFGGEFVERTKLLFRSLRKQRPMLNNSYGPTETSCATTLCTVTPEEDSAPKGYVGKPISNSHIYILDEGGNLADPECPGEICISGPGLALGYLNPSLTEDRFILKDVRGHGCRMYKTGDRGRLQSDGSLILMGRIDGDSQVKLRGIRIDTAEIEDALVKAIPNFLLEAVVTMRGEGEMAYLVAHVVVAPGIVAKEAELQLLLRFITLPAYMLPKTIFAVQKLPMTANGKIDRRAIAEMPLPHQQSKERPSAVRLAEAELSIIWRSVLEQDGMVLDLDSDSDFFLVGGNSSLLVKLQADIKTRMGLSVPLVELYGASTLSGMTEKITAMKQVSKPQGPIDWDIETKIPDQFLRLLNKNTNSGPPRRQPGIGREVVLTGANEFLGMEILLALLGDGSISKVHCIAVPEGLQATIPLSPKVIVYTGNLRDPTLGLSDAETRLLESRADVIIHAGGEGHCLNNYSTIRAGNLLSTQFLAKLALERRIALHYISNNRVILFSGKSAYPPLSLAEYQPPTDGSAGFSAAKWASECFLEELSRRATGLPVTIHRPCAMIGENADPKNATDGLIKSSSLTHSVPRLQNVDGYLDVKDVREIAKDIVGHVVSPLEYDSGEIPVRFVHHSSGHKIPSRDIARVLQMLYGGEYREIEMSQWLVEAEKVGLDPLAAVYLEAMMDEHVTGTYPYMGEQVDS